MSSSHRVLPTELEPAVALLVAAVVSTGPGPYPIHVVEATIEKMRPAVEAIHQAAADPDLYELVAQTAMQRVAVDIAPPIVLAPDFEPWFEKAVIEGRTKLERWYSYKQFLTHAKGYGPQVLDALDNASSEVIDLLGDPQQSGSWKRRGLVIGDVQSGKTATYIGIVNKAADAGFKLVVLLTGGTESLRQQTQYRVDEGLLGTDSTITQDKIIGVGNYPTKRKFLRGQGMTTQLADFNAGALKGNAVQIDPNADHPYVFVIKKNKTPLSNLITWLSGQFNDEKFNIPMLVVDDESDYASVNTNYKTTGDTSPTIINQKIRELLALTTRSSYMAFTATPFANVFIDHTSYSEALADDLFPHHYIYALSSPSNYVGAKRYFGTAEDARTAELVDITDAYDIFPPKHKSHQEVDSLPESLSDAIKTFVVASAIRVHRGDTTPRSMLVNVSRFKNVQSQVYELVAQDFAAIKAAIEIHAQPPVIGDDVHATLRELALTFTSHFGDVGVTWEEVRDSLMAAVFSTTVELVNSSRDKKTDDKPRNMIAVGGDVLSRGLTLEGLTVSYFYRVVGAADTLLQMARWFGYRPGYDDLVRVWISPEIADQFRFVSDVSEELRDQIREMRDLGKTPEDFGLMIRKHPETLAITAKKGVAESHTMVISLSGRRIETPKLSANSSVLSANEAAVSQFVAAIDADEPDGSWEKVGAYQRRENVSRERVADLLESFRYDRGNLVLANSLHKIIRGQTSTAFQDWTVCIVGGSEAGVLPLSDHLVLASSPARAVRYSPEAGGGAFRISGKSARLAGSTDLAKTYEHPGLPDLTEPEVYKQLPSPTLLIYPVVPKLEVNPSGEGAHAVEAALAETDAAKAAWAKARAAGVSRLMALKIAIPGDAGDKKGDVEYMLNGPAIDEFRDDLAVAAEDEDDLDD